ncbi:EAL domain-containing protein [Actinoplanes sp. NPDC051633]|uniref:EAL domain-containing protein n=1 Tax=Actinoplanes sp. NPDC051633 TaxID=3155670 RepID=UPI00342FD3E1
MNSEPVTNGMMIAALNQILAECGYPPVPPDPGRTAERLIEDARHRADGIVAAAQETAEQYTDAALAQAARTVISTREIMTTVAPPPEATRGVLAEGEVGAVWHAAVIAAGVYLPLPASEVRYRLHVLAGRLLDAARAEPPDVAQAWRAGADAVDLGLGSPAVLPGTVRLLAAYLPAEPAGGEVLGSFLGGHAAAMQERIRTQQEALHRATLRAAREFEVALADSEARYHRLAYFDPLTGLANRARLLQRLDQAARTADPVRHVGLCLIDLCGFPAIREQIGPEAGDHILIDVARRLRGVARDPDLLLVRHGTHSFSVLAQDSGGMPHLVEIAERVLRLLEVPVSLPDGGPGVPLEAAVGVVDASAAGLDASRLLVDAEVAVRRARTGRIRWAAHDRRPGPRPAADTVSGMVTAPPTYQPIVTPAGHRVLGVHVRALWRHPHLGSLDLGRIGELTGDRTTTTRLARQVLHQVCRQAMAWSGAPDGPYVGIDLPIRRIGYPEVVELVREALTTSGLSPARLRLHLSGLDAVPAGAHSHAVLAALGGLGTRLVLDDFGAGYTSVAYLRGLPIHGLRCPLPLLTGGNARLLVSGLATVAHALGLVLTVHGVDDERMAEAVEGTGCDEVQGLRYAAPATPHRVSGLLRSGPYAHR